VRTDNGSNISTPSGIHGAAHTVADFEQATTVLIVDDDPPVRAMLARLLESHGCRTRVARDVKTARPILEAERIDLVISDVVMPGVSGIEFRRQMAASRPSLPFILISGYSPDMPAAVAAGIAQTRFLQKPFAVGALVGMVNELLSSQLAAQSG
jgi:DNA-binding NtrC family response regulator